MTTLQDLSDQDLLVYHSLLKDLNPRHLNTRKFNLDTKFAYHIVRLLNEVEQILTEGDLDLQRSREQLKSVRRGEWKESEITEFFNDNEKRLEDVYQKSDLRHSPDMDRIRALLFECLEMHYDLSDSIVTDVTTQNKLDRIQDILNEA